MQRNVGIVLPLHLPLPPTSTPYLYPGINYAPRTSTAENIKFICSKLKNMKPTGDVNGDVYFIPLNQ